MYGFIQIQGSKHEEESVSPAQVLAVLHRMLGGRYSRPPRTSKATPPSHGTRCTVTGACGQDCLVGGSAGLGDGHVLPRGGVEAAQVAQIALDEAGLRPSSGCSPPSHPPSRNRKSPTTVAECPPRGGA